MSGSFNHHTKLCAWIWCISDSFVVKIITNIIYNSNMKSALIALGLDHFAKTLSFGKKKKYLNVFIIRNAILWAGSVNAAI